MRAKRDPKIPIYPDGTRVVFPYSSWQCPENGWDITATVAASRFWENSAGRYYTLRLDDVGDVDKVDREAIEGQERNLYGWLAEKSLRPG